MLSDRVKNYVNVVADKAAYVFVILFAIGFVFAMGAMLGWVGVILLIAMFIILLVLKLGIFWMFG